MSGGVANPDTVRFKDYENPFVSGTPCGKVLGLLCGICPGLGWNRSEQDRPARGHQSQQKPEPKEGALSYRDASEMTSRADFGEFIRTEL